MKNLIAQVLVCLSILTIVQINIYAAGVVDRSFGTNGTVTTVAGFRLQPKKIKTQPDGKILVLGVFDSGTSPDMALVRYNPNGSLDAGFGTNGIVTRSFSANNESVNDFALQSDGKIVVVGWFFSSATQSTDFLVARFNQNGSFDTSFGTGGIATVNQSSTDYFFAVAVQPDNKIVAVGSTSQNIWDFAALRFNPNGSLDSGFAGGGLFFYDMGQFRSGECFYAVDILPNGRIALGGTGFETSVGGGIDMLMMLESNGAFAQNFGTNGRVEEYFPTYSAGNAYDLAVQPDGKIVTISSRLFRRVLSNGTQDPYFRNRYFPYDSTDNAGTALALRSDGKIVVMGQGQSAFIGYTVMYDPYGRDINSDRRNVGTDVAVQSDNRFIVLNVDGDSFVLKRFIAISSPGTRLADLDYDEKTDLVVLRGGQHVYVSGTSQGEMNYWINRVPGDTVRVMPEDYTTSNAFSVYYWRVTGAGPNRPANFEGTDQSGNNRSAFQWGMTGDIPVGGDFDGETLTQFIPRFRKTSEFGIFRPSTGDWWLYNRRTGVHWAYHWGATGDKPVPADYDYDGVTDYAVFRPSTGTWWVHRSADDSYFTLQFGLPTDIPLVGDYDGDGRADFTAYRPSEGCWYQFLTSEGYRTVQFGLSTDIPVPNDYDGDGKTDIAVYREGVWYLLQSSEGYRTVQWGGAGDTPVTTRYDQ